MIAFNSGVLVGRHDMGSPAHRLDPPSMELPTREAEALSRDGLLDEAEAPPSDDDLCDGTDFSDDGATDDDISRVHFDDDGAGGELVSSLSMIQLDVSPSRSSWSACPTRLLRDTHTTGDGDAETPAPRRSRDEAVADALRRARREGRRQRFRVSCTTGVLGAAATGAGCLLVVTQRVASDAWYAGGVSLTPGLVCFLLAVRPCDRRAVVAVAYVAATVALMCCVVSVAEAARHGGGGCDARDEAKSWYCAAFLVAWWAALAVVAAEAGVAAARSARSRGGALAAVWRVVGRAALELGALLVVDRVVGIVAGAYDPARSSPRQAAWFAAVPLELLVVGCATRRDAFRSTVHAFLASRDERSRVAAVVAGLMHGSDPDVVRAAATRELRAVSLADVAYEDFVPTPAAAGPARDASVGARFGEIDAFLSHSWSDPVDAKWRALQAWRRRFKRRRGREPLVWIDKYCIRQGADIAEQLAVLPIFLAACDRLLVLKGPTYLDRLWCVMELFVFFAMGAPLSKIDLRLLDEPRPTEGGDDESKDEERPSAASRRRASSAAESLRASLAAFDVRSTACRGEATRDALLGIIESGFGSHGAFDDALAATLHHVHARRELRSLRSRATPEPSTARSRRPSLATARGDADDPSTSSLDSASRTPRSSWWRLGSSKHRFVFKPSSQRGSQLALSSSESRAPARGTLTT